MGGKATLTWRGYLLAMLQEDLQDPDIDPKAREVFEDAIRGLSSESSTSIPELSIAVPTSDLPPHLEFLAGYPAELRERTLQRLKADGILP